MQNFWVSFISLFRTFLAISIHSFYLNLCISYTFCLIFGSKLGQKWAKCTGYTIKPVHKYSTNLQNFQRTINVFNDSVQKPNFCNRTPEFLLIWGFAIFLTNPLFSIIFNSIAYLAKNLLNNNLKSIYCCDKTVINAEIINDQ